MIEEVGGMTITQTSAFEDPMAEELYEEESALNQAMVSEEQAEEGTFLTGGNTRAFVDLQAEKEIDEELLLNPLPVRDGAPLLDFLRKNLHKFDSPYAYIGGEANSPDQTRYHTSNRQTRCA
jgi:hypothetical protein